MIGLPNVHVDFNYREWFEQDNPHLQQFDELEAQFGSNESSSVIIHNPSGIFTSDTLNLIISLANELKQVPSTTHVDSITNFDWIRADNDYIEISPLIPSDTQLTKELIRERKEIALNHPIINGYLLSKDAKTSIIFVKMRPFYKQAPNYREIVDEIKTIINKYNNKGGHQIYLSGDVPGNDAFREAAENDIFLLVPLVLCAIGIFLWIMLRNLKTILLSYFLIFVTVAAVLGFAGLTSIEMNNVTIMVPQFMVAISISISVHILMTFLLFLNKGITKKTAIRMSFKKNLRPTLLTSLTTIFGFLSFCSAEIPAIMKMGILAAFGVLVAWIFTYSLLFPLLMVIPFKSIQTRKESLNTKNENHIAKAVTNFIYRFRTPIVVVGILLGVLSLNFASKVEISSDPFKYFDKDFYLTISNSFAEENLGGVLGAEIIIDSGKDDGAKSPEFLNKVELLQKYVETFPFVTKTISIIDILKDTNKALHNGLNKFYKLPQTKEEIGQQLLLYSMSLPDGKDLNDRIGIKNDIIRLTAMWNLHDSVKAIESAKAIEKKANELGLNAVVSGKAFLWQTIVDPIVHSFIKSLTIAVFLISLLLMIGFKSLRIGALALIPNTLPLVFGAATVFFIGETLNIGTVIVSAIVLGIAVDDTIHFLSNYLAGREKGDSPKEITSTILSLTAPALISTTVVLAMSFGMCAFATFVPIKIFGILVAILLTAALIIDLIFLPALLFIAGKYLKRSR